MSRSELTDLSPLPVCAHLYFLSVLVSTSCLCGRFHAVAGRHFRWILSRRMCEIHLSAACVVSTSCLQSAVFSTSCLRSASPLLPVHLLSAVIPAVSQGDTSDGSFQGGCVIFTCRRPGASAGRASRDWLSDRPMELFFSSSPRFHFTEMRPRQIQGDEINLCEMFTGVARRCHFLSE